MAKIGNLGKLIVFETSDKKILNFNDFTQDVSGRWSSHNRIMRKPLSEFNGPDLRSISFVINLNAMLGVKPSKIIKNIENAVERGLTYKLVIGGKKVGKYKWKITNMSEKWSVVFTRGELVQAALELTLEEYL